jgi:hypothetical protein
MMRAALPFSALLLPTLLLAAPASAAPICLQPRDMVSTTSPDGKILVVTMRDGTVWHNQLLGTCPGLKFEGYSWVIHDPTGVCENSQSLKVLRTGEVCLLGKFVKQPAKAKPAAKPGGTP